MNERIKTNLIFKYSTVQINISCFRWAAQLTKKLQKMNKHNKCLLINYFLSNWNKWKNACHVFDACKYRQIKFCTKREISLCVLFVIAHLKMFRMKFKNIPCDHRMTIRDNKKFLKMETLARYYNDRYYIYYYYYSCWWQ